MKKAILLFILFFACAKISASPVYEDRTSEVRTMVAKDAARLGYDSVNALKAFDELLKVFKVKAIYLISSKTGLNQYRFFGNAIVINADATGTTVLQRVIAELTHAAQFRRRPFYYVKSASLSFGRTFLKTIFNPFPYRNVTDSIQQSRHPSPSRLRAAFISVYLQDEYDDPRSFEYEAHAYIEKELYRFFNDIVFVIPYLSKKDLKQWLKMRKKFFYKDLRHWQGSFCFS